MLQPIRRHILCTLAILTLTLSIPAHTQEKGSWRAASKSAKSITGDIAFTDQKFSLNFLAFTIAHIRNVEPTEIRALFDPENPAPATGSLYRLSIPATTRFLHKNTLCAADDTQWIVTAVTGRTLQLAFFSGETMPVLTTDAIVNATNLCGTYLYTR